METPNEESLRKMPYSQLKKFAKKKGIRGSMKACDIISSLLAENSKTDEDSFVQLERQILNSSIKNKENLFDAEKMVAIETPRRGTFTVEADEDRNEALNTPVIEPSSGSKGHYGNVTLTRGSERKKRRRNVSFVTPIRRSVRLIGGSPPQFMSVKDRPKTPIPNKNSSNKKRMGSTSGGKSKRPSTPMPKPNAKKMKLSDGAEVEQDAGYNSGYGPKFEKILEGISEQTPYKGDLESSTPIVVKQVNFDIKEEDRSFTAENAASPILKSSSSKDIKTMYRIRPPTPMKQDKGKFFTPPASNETRRSVTPFPKLSSKGLPTPNETRRSATPFHKLSSKGLQTPIENRRSATPYHKLSAKRLPTPNFQAIHEKAFSKMESIADYQKRKAENSTKRIREQAEAAKKARQQASSVKKAEPGSVKKIHEQTPIHAKPLKKQTANKKKEVRRNQHGGIPFIPSVTSTKDMKLEFFGRSAPVTRSSKNKAATAPFAKSNIGKPAASKINVKKSSMKSAQSENTPLKRKLTFDLKSSLTKKLSYKPYAGPLKPINESAFNTSLHASTPYQSVKAVQRRIPEKRNTRRQEMKGDRSNKRFELQMRNRNMSCK